jgi:hypothetical protein
MPDACGNVGHLSALLIAVYIECSVNTVSKNYILTGIVSILIAAEFGELHGIPDSLRINFAYGLACYTGLSICKHRLLGSCMLLKWSPISRHLGRGVCVSLLVAIPSL